MTGKRVKRSKCRNVETKKPAPSESLCVVSKLRAPIQGGKGEEWPLFEPNLGAQGAAFQRPVRERGVVNEGGGLKLVDRPKRLRNKRPKCRVWVEAQGGADSANQPQGGGNQDFEQPFEDQGGTAVPEGWGELQPASETARAGATDWVILARNQSASVAIEEIPREDGRAEVQLHGGLKNQRSWNGFQKTRDGRAEEY